jgi:hypothetical protein
MTTVAPTAKVRVVDDKPPVELSISSETVCFIIVKAREFDVKDEVTEPDPGSNPIDDGGLAVLEDHPDDPSGQEIRATIAALSVDEKAELIALAWLGRGDYDVKEWRTARSEAETQIGKTASYLLELPLLGDYLEEGLSMVGRDCEDVEAEHLG